MDNALSRMTLAGLSGASTTDLLAVALSSGENDLLNAEVRGRDLLISIGSMANLADISKEQLRTSTSHSEFEINRHLAWLELGRRTANAGRGDSIEVMSPEHVVKLLSFLQREKREHFVVVLLDTKNQLLKWVTIHIGTLTMSVVGPREVFREAIREGASSIIVAHNHPSGDPDPSPEDISITMKLAEIGEMLDIRVWDHIIIGHGPGKYRSLRRDGVFDGLRANNSITSTQRT